MDTGKIRQVCLSDVQSSSAHLDRREIDSMEVGSLPMVMAKLTRQLAKLIG